MPSISANPMVSNRAACQPQAGFSLIMVSILLTVAALIFVSLLPGQEAGDLNQKTINNTKKLERVEEAMHSFMAFNGRRPCPADGQYVVNTANFGKEAANPGTCTGGTPSAPLGPDATGFVVGGVIPTRSLGLPDEYQYDEFGHRFTYVVDTQATANNYCINLEDFNPITGAITGTGHIKIENATGGTVIDNVMYAYISHGASGYGAFPAQGSSVANRINSGSTDTDMQTNAGVNSSFTYSTTNFTNVKVQKARVAPTSGDTGFDDLVWYRNDIKNTCCLGTLCVPLGIRIDGQSGTYGSGPGSSYQSMYTPFVAAVGDINGDGIPDLIIAFATSNGGTGDTMAFVIFGTATGWPFPPAGFSPATVNGTNGFAIFSSNGAIGNYNNYITIADINGDGYGDIIFDSGGKEYIIFGGPGGVTTPWLPASATSMNVSNLNGFTGTNGTSGVVINMTGTNGVFSTGGFMPEGIEVGDIDNDGHPDLIVTGVIGNNGNKVPDVGFVIYGMPTASTGGGSGTSWCRRRPSTP